MITPADGSPSADAEAPIRQQYLPNHATIAVCISDHDSDNLPEGEPLGQLLRLRAEGLRLLWRVDAIQPDLHDFALTALLPRSTLIISPSAMPTTLPVNCSAEASSGARIQHNSTTTIHKFKP